MAGRPQFEFFLLRYVPHAVKEEFVNVGLVMFEAGGSGFAEVKFTRDWRRILSFDPQADVDLLAALERDIRRQLVDMRSREELFRTMADSFSNTIQLSSTKGCLTQDPVHELKTVASFYLDSTKVAVKKVSTGRQQILEKMREAFKEAGVMRFVLPVPVAPYTKMGDPFQFDFGYRVGEKIKLFHAVSLKASVETAVTLASRYSRIAPVMSDMIQATPTLTAVIHDDLDRGDEKVQFALSIMEEEKIRIAVAAEMSMIAEVARQELRA